MKNTFDKGPEGWCSYDYHWSVVADGKNIFMLATWEPSGGVNDTGHIWSDHTRWSADTPETPVSILPLLLYTNWVGLDPLDLRNAEVSVYLRGDDLLLDSAKCYFWVHTGHTRWHCTSHPLEISDGAWVDRPNVVTLTSDESLWHKSWSLDPNDPIPLEDVLSSCMSFGFSFVGFKQEPRGRLSMDGFEIKLA